MQTGSVKQKPCLPCSGNNAAAGSCTSLYRSCAVPGVIFFLFCNLILFYLNPLSRVDPESLPAAHTWTWWAAQEFQAEKTTPAIVLAGSSLMMHPISRLDADFLNKDLDYVHHHRSQYLKGKLSRLLKGTDAPCFNFALPGSMISDDYMLARAMFAAGHKPRLLVLGLSLRDFIDSGVTCPAATPPFKYFSRYVVIDDILDVSIPQFWRRFDYYTGKVFYLWNKKLDAQVVLTEGARHMFAPLLARIYPPASELKTKPARCLPNNLRSEVEEGMFIVTSHQPYSWEDNSREYSKRYKIKYAPMFDIQTTFLSKLLDYCQAADIAVLLVNMPLTEQNMSLMPAGYYTRYLDVLTRQAHCRNLPFLDLNAGGSFQQCDFYDTSHMNACGGKKLLDSISLEIVNNKKLCRALSNRPVAELAQGTRAN